MEQVTWDLLERDEITYLQTGGYTGAFLIPLGGRGKIAGLGPRTLPKSVSLLNGLQVTKDTHVPHPMVFGPERLDPAPAVPSITRSDYGLREIQIDVGSGPVLSHARGTEHKPQVHGEMRLRLPVPALFDVHLGSRRPFWEKVLIPPSEGELVDDGGANPTIGQIVVDPHLDLEGDAGVENNSMAKLSIQLISMYASGLYSTLDAVATLMFEVSWLQFLIKPCLLSGVCLPLDVVWLV